jgi:2,3-bisphosphoglycerate-dependent phosphoglycerate mutase
MTFRNWWTLRHTPALRGLPRRAVRRTESLSDVVRRVCPLYETDLLPVVLGGATVLVVAHGNSLRALCACIDDLTEKEVADLNLPTGQPLLYRVGEDRALHPRGGEYLDPTADDAAALVAAEGGT